MKKKKILILSGVLIVVLMVIGIGTFCYFDKQRKLKEEKILDIQNHYAKFVKVNSEISLYKEQEGEYVSFGSATNMALELEDIVIESDDKTYFKIHNSDLYVYYSDVEPLLDTVFSSVPAYYLESKSKIQSDKETRFYRDGEEVFSIDEGMEFPFLYQTDNYYGVSYLGQIWELKKDEVSLSREEDILEQAKYVSSLVFSEIKEDCKGNTCITPENVKKLLSFLKEKERYSITKKDYEMWVLDNVALKDGAILVTFQKEEDASYLEEFGFEVLEKGLKFNTSNKASYVGTDVEAIDSYLITNETTEEQYTKILNGEEIVIPKKVLATPSSKNLPSESAKATHIAVLNYHFFYDSSIGESCGEGICLDTSKFREQLEFLKQNNYKTLTMEEYRAWMYGEIELPARSVLLTIDDGAMGTGKHNGNKLIPLLEEYNMHATLFLITGWWSKDNYLSNNLDIESHTYDMHKEGLCSNEARGAQLLCSSKDAVMKDLEWSINITGSNKAFCFPFYAYNDSAIQSVKDAGFKLAFIGGSTKSHRGNDKYKIPRYPIHSDITLNQFINMIA